jgi:Ca2+-binding EF-hand superfamily protein
MRLFAVLYIPILVGVMSHFLGSVASLIMDIQRKALMQHMQSRSLLLEDLMDMDTDGDGVVTEAEFIVFMLTKMQKVDRNLLDELRQHFRRFDIDNNGSIEKSDLYEVFLKTLKRPKKMLELSQYKASLLHLSDKDLSDNRHQIHLFDRVRSSVLKSVSSLTGWNKKTVQ